MRYLFREICYLSLYLLVADLKNFANSVFVTEDNTQDCVFYGTTLQCDFRFSTQDVRMDESVNKFKTVFVMNAEQLLLRNGLCTSLNLYHIASVIYTSSSYAKDINNSCENNALYLHNVTIDHIPPNLHILSMENSRLLGSFLNQPSLKRLKVSSSSLNQLSLDTPVYGEGDVRLHATNISSLVKMEMTDSSKFFITDSRVLDMSDSSIILHRNATAEFMRTMFLQKRETVIFHDGDARITMANITGLITIVHRRSDKDDEVQDGVPGHDKNRTSVSAVILSLLLVSSMILNFCAIALVLRQKRFKRTSVRISHNELDDGDEVIHETKFIPC